MLRGVAAVASHLTDDNHLIASCKFLQKNGMKLAIRVHRHQR